MQASVQNNQQISLKKIENNQQIEFNKCLGYNQQSALNKNWEENWIEQMLGI